MVWVISRIMDTDLGRTLLDPVILPEDEGTDEMQRYINQGFELDEFSSEVNRQWYDKYDKETGWHMVVCFELMEEDTV